jgi:hypothetical protein
MRIWPPHRIHWGHDPFEHTRLPIKPVSKNCQNTKCDGKLDLASILNCVWRGSSEVALVGALLLKVKSLRPCNGRKSSLVTSLTKIPFMGVRKSDKKSHQFFFPMKEVSCSAIRVLSQDRMEQEGATGCRRVQRCLLAARHCRPRIQSCEGTR